MRGGNPGHVTTLLLSLSFLSLTGPIRFSMLLRAQGAMLITYTSKSFVVYKVLSSALFYPADGSLNWVSGKIPNPLSTVISTESQQG